MQPQDDLVTPFLTMTLAELFMLGENAPDDKQLTSEEIYHFQNWQMAKNWNRMPWEWRGHAKGPRHEDIVALNYLDGLFRKRQRQQEDMARQKAESEANQRAAAASGQRIVESSHGF